MTRIQNRLQSVGQTMQRIGTGMSLGGAALGAPLLLAGRQAAGFEDAILGMQGAAGLSAAEIERVRAAALELSKEMGVSPTKLANAFLELTKAGMSVDDVLAGAGRSAVEFSRVSGVDAARSAVFMKTAMNTFGVSATQAVDTLSAAADSSETSIEAMVESFSQIGSTGNAFGQSLFGVSQALAVLAKNGIVGEEAGTGLKTLVTKLIAPTNDAQEALARLGLTVADFRDATGKPLGMEQIAVTFEKAMNSMKGNPAGLMEAQAALVDVFEQRGIKIITAFANAGKRGFDEVANEMQASLSVADKFLIAMSGLSGQMEKLNAAIERISIAFGSAISGPFKQTADQLTSIMDIVAWLVEKFPVLGTAAASIAAGMVAIGVAAIAAGIAMKSFAQISMVVAALSGPRGWIALAAIALGGLAAYMSTSFGDATDEVKKAKAEVEGLGKGAKGNAAKPDVPRKPMEGDPFAARKAAEELAKEDAAFDEAQGKAIERLKELQYNIVEEVKDLGEAGFNAAVNFQRDIDDVIRQVEAGIANPQLAEVLSKRAKDMFDADIEQYKKSLEEQTRDFGDSAGTFGNGVGMGIGPRLAKFVKKFTIELRDRGEKAIAAAMPAAGVDPTYGPNPEWLARQAARAKAGADMAAAGAGVAAGGRGGMDAVVNAVREDVKATEESNAILTKILNNTGKGLAFQ